MNRSCEAVARHLGVPRATGSRWAGELGWSPRHGNGPHPTLTVGQCCGLEVYGTLVAQHRTRRQWQPLAQQVAGHIDGPSSNVRWLLHVPAIRGTHEWRTGDADVLARFIDQDTAHGRQVIVVDLAALTARWGGDR